MGGFGSRARFPKVQVGSERGFREGGRKERIKMENIVSFSDSVDACSTACKQSRTMRESWRTYLSECTFSN